MIATPKPRSPRTRLRELNLLADNHGYDRMGWPSEPEGYLLHAEGRGFRCNQGSTQWLLLSKAIWRLKRTRNIGHGWTCSCYRTAKVTGIAAKPDHVATLLAAAEATNFPAERLDRFRLPYIEGRLLAKRRVYDIYDRAIDMRVFSGSEKYHPRLHIHYLHDETSRVVDMNHFLRGGPLIQENLSDDLRNKEARNALFIMDSSQQQEHEILVYFTIEQFSEYIELLTDIDRFERADRELSCLARTIQRRQILSAHQSAQIVN